MSNNSLNKQELTSNDEPSLSPPGGVPLQINPTPRVPRTGKSHKTREKKTFPIQTEKISKIIKEISMLKVRKRIPWLEIFASAFAGGALTCFIQWLTEKDNSGCYGYFALGCLVFTLIFVIIALLTTKDYDIRSNIKNLKEELRYIVSDISPSLNII